MSSRMKTALAIGLGILLLAAAYVGGRWLETRDAQPETRGDYRQREVYEIVTAASGESYRKRKGITTILLMGVDREGTAPGVGYRNGGQADFLRLMVVDSVRKSVAQVQIDRDTMTPITILGVLGNRSGVRTSQICLAHGFGDGGEQSCLLTVEAVSNLLGGTPIDFYMALQMDGISVLNDSVGGITVTLEDDFTALDPSMVKGTTLTLQGEQAEYFVRSRMNIGVGTNEARMARQEQYVEQMTQVLQEKLHADKAFVGQLYDELTPYLTTNISRGRLINEVWAARDYERTALIEPKGTHEIGADGFMQFQVDQAALEETMMELLYEKVT